MMHSTLDFLHYRRCTKNFLSNIKDTNIENDEQDFCRTKRNDDWIGFNCMTASPFLSRYWHLRSSQSTCSIGELHRANDFICDYDVLYCYIKSHVKIRLKYLFSYTPFWKSMSYNMCIIWWCTISITFFFVTQL